MADSSTTKQIDELAFGAHRRSAAGAHRRSAAGCFNERCRGPIWW